ncbi:hypothetical protein GOP47_0008356 [Adiantum capillus-veneris]|uniref:non-specific serine/threonine protein kinase n=1 Tax=Adiantum capillus-veneris TaxID=13818 RepID=A0A9D4UY90_ADICA|nr:hypothetical protein GOP47_0008356 [Adiantum capillus-veneris]
MKAIILEFIPNKSVEYWLHEHDVSEGAILTWNQRLGIVKGVAQGLVYLHHDYDKECIVHCDLKPSNILLGQDMQPHIADFGIARILQHPGIDANDAANASTWSTIFQGSIGYVPPGIV